MIDDVQWVKCVLQISMQYTDAFYFFFLFLQIQIYSLTFWHGIIKTFFQFITTILSIPPRSIRFSFSDLTNFLSKKKKMNLEWEWNNRQCSNRKESFLSTFWCKMLFLSSTYFIPNDMMYLLLIRYVLTSNSTDRHIKFLLSMFFFQLSLRWMENKNGFTYNNNKEHLHTHAQWLSQLH